VVVQMRAVQAISPDDLGVLLTWFAVLRACAVVLGVEALGLGVLSLVRPPRGCCALALSYR
jgi:hypothetical protein